FVINYDTSPNGTTTAGNANANGPVPVLAPFGTPPTTGNGFATGSGGLPGGITDFVEFDSQQPQGYGLYHVVGDPNTRADFVYQGAPVAYTIPDPNDPATANTIQFQLDLSQLITGPNGQPLADAAARQQAANQAKQIRFLEVNIVSTNLLPTDQSTSVVREVDSMGDDRTTLAASSFLVMDLQAHPIYSSSDITLIGSALEEPSEPDLFIAGSNASPYLPIDLTDWTLEIRQQ
ncbi:MAG TPA: hypothetical protein VGS41_03735, partial [Chthonomonadales bacterium]|nr:hypothetical protein [Chthonomonadales bacterium]